ncbi:MAG: hypothetical protein SYC29_12140 [Planctomycetota bacterium]|nr:hypothetical protein [Planctomycetota bacterium]
MNAASREESVYVACCARAVHSLVAARPPPGGRAWCTRAPPARRRCA